MTGWKSVFVNRGFTRRIQGVTKDESDTILAYLFNVSAKKKKKILLVHITYLADL